MKPLPIVICALLLSTLASAKPKPVTQSYTASCAKVWVAAKSVVMSDYDVLNLNDATRSGSFSTGNALTGVRSLAFSLSGTGNTCTVSVTGHFSGLIHSDKGSFFKRIEKELPANTSAKATKAK